jgi:hypothetical protein
MVGRSEVERIRLDAAVDHALAEATPAALALREQVRLGQVHLNGRNPFAGGGGLFRCGGPLAEE